MRHEWRQVTLVQTPPRMKCLRCGMVRRWSMNTESYAYYAEGKGYVGGRPGPCATQAPGVEPKGEP